jgi:hypothetical protein
MAFDASAETNQPWWDASLHRIRAEILFHLAGTSDGGGPEGEEALLAEAENEWQSAIALAEERGQPVHGVRAAAGYALFLARKGRVEEATGILRDRLGRCPDGATAPVLVAATGVLAELERQAASG